MTLIKRRRLMLGIVLAITMTVTACTGTDGEDMVKDPDLTKQAAIKQTLEYLERTEASLPEGMALSANSDFPRAVKREGSISGSIPCSSSDGANHADPHKNYMGYFVTGVPDGEGAKYLLQIRQLWESWGWTPTKEPDEQSAAYVNEAGYTLELQTSVQGAISIMGETPCIAGDNLQGSDEVPQGIGGE